MRYASTRDFARKSTWLVGSAVALVLVCGAGAVQAAEAVTDVKIDPENADYGARVDELVVTAKAPVVDVAPTKASLEATEPQSIIERKAIDQFVPATSDYTQVVNLSPSASGVSVNGPGLGEAKTTLRGFQDGEYNITYDGIPWGDANGPTHHSTSFFPSSTIGAVVVDRGPGDANQLGVASFGGSVNLFSPEVSDTFGGSQAITGGTANTWMSVTKLSTGRLDKMNGTKILFNLQELSTDGYLTHNNAKAYNQLVRAVAPIVGSWELTLLGTWNYTKIHEADKEGATLTQVALYGKRFGLTTDPASPAYYGYNQVTKHTYFNYARLNGDVTSTLKLEDTLYSYFYKNDTESALDVTLSPADIAARKGLQITTTPGGKPVVNGHVPGYTKLNVYKIYGNVLRLNQDLPFGAIKAGLWLEKADTGPRARVDYDATLGMGLTAANPDYRQKVLAGVPQTLEYLQYSGWKQYEPFIDFVWKPTSQLTVTPGVKYVHEAIRVDADVNQKSRQPFHGGKTFSKTLYFLTANYKIQDNLSVYAQYATGFLVPDISISQVPNPNFGDLKPQQSTNYQAGVVYHGNRFTVDADVYDIDFTNKLQTITIGTETLNYNLGGAKYKGVEGAVTFQAIDHLFLIANGSINSAKASGANTSIAGVPVVIAGGKQISSAPKGTAALGVIWDSAQWTVSVMDKYTGVQWAAEGEPAAYKIPGFHQTDVSATWRFGRYRVQGSLYNLFDSQKVTNIKPGKTVPYDQYYFQPGREYQVQLKVNF